MASSIPIRSAKAPKNGAARAPIENETPITKDEAMPEYRGAALCAKTITTGIVEERLAIPRMRKMIPNTPSVCKNINSSGADKSKLIVIILRRP